MTKKFQFWSIVISGQLVNGQNRKHKKNFLPQQKWREAISDQLSPSFLIELNQKSRYTEFSHVDGWLAFVTGEIYNNRGPTNVN